MRSQKKFAVIIFVLAGIALAYGVVTHLTYIGSQNMLIEYHRSSGTPEEQIALMVGIDMAPEMLARVVPSLAATLVLVALGCLTLQVSALGVRGVREQVALPELAPAEPVVYETAYAEERAENTPGVTDTEDKAI
jgi:hypothetical protein